MSNRLQKTAAAAALALVVTATPMAAASEALAPSGRSSPQAADASRQPPIEMPGWLVWLQSLFLGQGAPPGEDSGPSDTPDEGESERGPSMDPNG